MTFSKEDLGRPVKFYIKVKWWYQPVKWYKQRRKIRKILVTYEDIGGTPIARLHLTRSMPFESGTYKVVAKVNGGKSLEVVGENGKKQTISFM